MWLWARGLIGQRIVRNASSFFKVLIVLDKLTTVWCMMYLLSTTNDSTSSKCLRIPVVFAWLRLCTTSDDQILRDEWWRLRPWTINNNLIIDLAWVFCPTRNEKLNFWAIATCSVRSFLFIYFIFSITEYCGADTMILSLHLVHDDS